MATEELIRWYGFYRKHWGVLSDIHTLEISFRTPQIFVYFFILCVKRLSDIIKHYQTLTDIIRHY